MRGRKLLIVILGSILLAGIAGGMWYYDYRQSPSYALSQLREAVEERNALKFERHAQIGHFAEVFVDEVLAVSARQALAGAGEDDGWAAVGRALGMGMIETVTPAAVNMAESAIREAIETGRADSVIREASTQEGQVRLASMANAAAVDLEGYRGMTEINEEGDVATVGFRFHNAVYDTTITFEVKMEQQNDRWQVTEPYNFGRLLRAVSARRDTLLARANRTMDTEANEMVGFGELRRWTSAPCRYCSDDLHIALPLTNTSDYTLRFVEVTFTSFGEPVDDGDFSLVAYRELAPGETRTLEESVDYNQFLDWHSTLRYGNLTPRIEMLTFRPPDAQGTRYVGQIEVVSDLERFTQRKQGPGVFISDATLSGARDTANAEQP